METIILSGNHLELEIPKFVVELIPLSGSADSAIEGIVSDVKVVPYLDNIDKDSLAKELYEYGAWSTEELKDHEENIKRILWIKVLDYNEENLIY